MIKCFTFLLIFFPFIKGFSNENTITKKRAGITFSSFGDCDIIRFQELDGAASYSSDYFFALGLSYQHSLNEMFAIETGIEYARYNIIVHPNVPPNVNFDPYRDNFSLMSIPVKARLNFLKLCFLDAGILIDVDAGLSDPIDSQTGIGANIGAGLNYDFKFGLSIFANPYTKIHALIPFSMEKYPQRVIETGIRFGLMYGLN